MSLVEVGWLSYARTEIANVARTSAYETLFPPQLTMSGCQACAFLTDGQTYASPAADPAPWYEPSRPESARFFGLVPMHMELLPGYRRDVQQNGSGGASIGPPVLGGRTFSVEGVMLADGLDAMRWGQAWLSEVLACGCNQCGTGDLCYVPACPTPDGTICVDDYLRVLADVALTDGPHFTPIVSDRGVMLGVAFQMTSRFGWQFAAPLLAAEGTFA